MLDGKRYSEGYSTQDEAEQRKRKIEAMIELDHNPRASVSIDTPLFRDLAEDAVCRYCADHELRPTTVENHKSVLKRHVLPYFGNTPVDATHFDREAVRGFIRHLRGLDGTPRILADSSVAVVLPTLSIVLDDSVEKKHLLQNPLRGGGRLWRKKAPQHAETMDPFTPEELRALIGAAYEVDHDFGCLVQIVSQCGLRPGEGLGLRRCDIDLKAAEVHVNGTFSRGRMGPTKTASSTRVVSLVDHVLVDEALSRSAIGRIKAMKLTSVDPEARLFPLTAPQYWPARWKRALAKAQVRYRKPHNLRHSFASILLSRGENILRVQKAGGWRSATVLLNVYGKWVDQGEKKSSPTGARMRAPRRVSLRGV